MSGLNGAAGSPDGGACQARPMSWETAMVPPSAHMAVDSSDTSTTVGLAGALAVQQRGRDATGDGHGADRVAERGSGLVERLGQVGGRDRVGDPGAGPEPERVVAAGVGVGAAVAVARAPHVDDVRVVGPDVVHLDLQLLADARHLVGEEDVGDRREPVEDVAPCRVGQVEAEALLAAVRVLDEHRHLAVEAGDAG